jgi:CBS domain-containing protein
MAVAARDLMLKAESLHVDDHGSTLIRKLFGKYRALPVINDDRRVVGIITEASIRRAIREETTLFRSTAGSLMTCGHLEHDFCRHPPTVSPDTPMLDVLRTMEREQLATIPVVQEGVLVGVINGSDYVLQKEGE